MDPIWKTTAVSGNHITSLMGTRNDPQLSTTVLEHLRHERKPFQAHSLIERGENLLLASYFDGSPSFGFQSDHGKCTAQT